MLAYLMCFCSLSAFWWHDAVTYNHHASGFQQHVTCCSNQQVLQPVFFYKQTQALDDHQDPSVQMQVHGTNCGVHILHLGFGPTPWENPACVVPAWSDGHCRICTFLLWMHGTDMKHDSCRNAMQHWLTRRLYWNGRSVNTMRSTKPWQLRKPSLKLRTTSSRLSSAV